MGRLRPPILDEAYQVTCWLTGATEVLPRYPRIVSYPTPPPPEIDDPATVEEATDYAFDSITFAPPQPVMNPGPSPIVGIETWLAVTAQLDYPEVHANAGPVSASVQPRFREAVWDLGNGDTVTCAGQSDATTVWNPGIATQSSNCSYTYADSGSGQQGNHDVTVTLFWDIYRKTSEQVQPAPWQYWDTIISTTTQTIQVTELQAVIN